VKSGIVWDAIALHATADIADRREPEVALSTSVAHVDVMGFLWTKLSPQLIDDTIALYPRLGFKMAFTAALAEVARKKPHTPSPLVWRTSGAAWAGSRYPERMRHFSLGAVES